MKLEDQVVSLELAKKLKELGVKQESLYLWTLRTEPATLWSLDRYEEKWGNNIGEGYDEFSAFTVAELGEMLPDKTFTQSSPSGFWTAFSSFHPKPYGLQPSADTEADARAKMLIYLIENNLITI